MDSDHLDCDYFFKFLTLGDSGVGKTSFLYYYCKGKFDNQFISTVGIDFRAKRLSYKPKNLDGSDSMTRNKRIYLQLWDTSGQERFRSLTNAFFRDAMGFILMFDITSERSFLNLQDWLEQLRTHGYSDHPNVILIGNKSDLFDKRVISQEKARQTAQKYGLNYIETSASTGQNVNEAVEILLDLVCANMAQVIENSDFLPNRITPSPKIRLQNSIFDRSSCSCYNMSVK